MSEIIFENYVGTIRANSQTAAVLAVRLEKSAPEDLKPEERKALKLVVATAREVQRVQSNRDRIAPGKLRPVLEDFINDWTALHGALGALARVSSSVSKSGPIAASLAATLFPDGVSFTRLVADRAWSEADRRLVRIREEELEEQIGELIGIHFLEGAKRSTGVLANAIGTGANSVPLESTTALQEALTQFGRAVGAYGRMLAANVDEQDEKSVERFVRAVAPIDQHRVSSRGRAEGEDVDTDVEPVDPAQPVAPTPPVTPPVLVVPVPTPTPTPEPVS